MIGIPLFDKKLKSEVFNNCSFLFNSSGIIFDNEQYFKPNFNDRTMQSNIKRNMRIKKKKILNFKILKVQHQCGKAEDNIK